MQTRFLDYEKNQETQGKTEKEGFKTLGLQASVKMQKKVIFH
jgi:hypothetical protein